MREHKRQLVRSMGARAFGAHGAAPHQPTAVRLAVRLRQCRPGTAVVVGRVLQRPCVCASCSWRRALAKSALGVQICDLLFLLELGNVKVRRC